MCRAQAGVGCQERSEERRKNAATHCALIGRTQPALQSPTGKPSTRRVMESMDHGMERFERQSPIRRGEWRARSVSPPPASPNAARASPDATKQERSALVGGFGKGGFGLQRLSSEEAAALISGLSKSVDGVSSRLKSDAKKPPVAPPPKSNKSSSDENIGGGGVHRGFELDLTRAALQPRASGVAGGGNATAVTSGGGMGGGVGGCRGADSAAPAVPPIPGFSRVRSSDSGPADEGASQAPVAMPGLTSMKIPNFARALSGELSASAPAKTGSLSARVEGVTGIGSLLSPRNAVEARRPLTARPAESLGVTTPRGTAMRGPMPGDRSMRGMDDLLAASALRTPRAGAGGPLTPRNGPMTPRDGPLMSPRSGLDGAPLRSPRGTGARSARRGGDECVKAPPARTSQRGVGGGVGRGGNGQGGGAKAGGSATDWLHAAMGGRGSSWLRHAQGGIVLVQADDAAVGGAAADQMAAAAGGGGGRSGGGRVVMGVVDGEARGLHGRGSSWRIRLSGGRVVVVEASALRRMPPERGDLARCVLGQSASLEGEVLSVEGGVAVLKASASEQEAESQQTELPRVRVLPIDALCRLAVDVQTDEPSEEAGAPMLS